MKIIREVTDLKDKKVLLRVDFDVPLRRGSGQASEIEEPFRIKKQKETIDWLLEREARVVMVGHISDLKSFSDLVPQLHILIGQEFDFIKSVADISAWLDGLGKIALLENVRHPSVAGDGKEEKNDPEFAKQLAEGFDIYVNNAFAVCHRDHASVSAITKVLPSYAGLLVEQEVTQLNKVIEAPKEGKVVIMGGAKASTKVPVIKNLIDKAETILLGGVVANDFLKEKGQDMGSSVVDENAHDLLMGLDLNDSRLVIPKDFVVFDNKILDVGDETMRQYIDIISKAEMVIWNGPIGLFENPIFTKGTDEIANAIISSKAISVIGGGDTISAVGKLGILDKFNFVSTGGGAMLTFLAGDKLPGLEALK
ncbi:MAG: phosphoglycerate kinase [Candidatus Yanofskybacteria bacterium RIFCSPHIGHO2_01_FULL_41_21]|uniref:Phosphoglycerate kinase n=1 Tax=Candidatus Yanofskybacteria bacterium RIFCSPHIGHO2_01_FULL_41_21 TaxID=1802660 RepID=A0A1F8EBE6_9BACT|nr:MAG: phosphoglycerate kinase [Candidatus Yanofskybacteria bacterium RIFCSPHIGHO2_01_FULL_41_21]